MIERLDREQRTATDRRNFIGGLWHGSFLASGVSLTQPTTAIAALAANLTGSTAWVGGLSTLLPVAFLSLLAGVLLNWRSYTVLFLLVAIFIALGAIWTRRLSVRPGAK